MFPTYVVALIAIVSYCIYSNVSALLKNIAAAKRSGLPYFILPVDTYNPAWQITHKLFFIFLDRLPTAWTESWTFFLRPDWAWDMLYDPMEKRGDVFLTVTPGAINAWLANAEAIHQVTKRREAFPKPLETYRVLEIFGRNIITTEGNDWKKHRKVSAPGFNEKNNVLVFSEACSQAQGMLRKWISGDTSTSTTLREVPEDTMRLTLHIISRIGFGVQLLWPGEKPAASQTPQDAIYSSNEPPKGHSMSFEDALSTLLERMIWVLVFPEWILKRLPFHSAQLAYKSFINWRQYLNELFAQKVTEAREGQHTEGMDVMGLFVRSSYGDTKNTSRKNDTGGQVLSDSDILGNCFVIMVAGHETTANSIHFSLVEMAMSPRSQRLAQKEVQRIFGNEPSENWDYDSNINSLLGGIIGAILNEQLRLMPPVITIPKSVSSSQDQSIVVDGKKFILPAKARVFLNVVGVQRNPRYWPTQPSKLTDEPDDLNDFRPERWLIKVDAEGEQHTEVSSASEDDDEFGGFTGNDTSAQLFRPTRGSYLPFSDGPRSCLGRRLAQVKIMAVFAVIFQHYSIELAVDEWATDEEVAKMSNDEKRALYKKAQDKAKETIRGATTIITLKLHPGFIPVRIVKRGEERFINIIE